jgi:hypothetical protein
MTRYIGGDIGTVADGPPAAGAAAGPPGGAAGVCARVTLDDRHSATMDTNSGSSLTIVDLLGSPCAGPLYGGPAVDVIKES